MSVKDEAVTTQDRSNSRWAILAEIHRERLRQDELKQQGKFKYTCADPELVSNDKFLVLAEEIGEVARAVLNMQCLTTDYQGSLSKVREELVQVSAVSLAWIEGIDRVTEVKPG